MTALTVPLDTLGATISAHIAKGDASIEKAEQHYKAAGIHLIEAKERVKATPGLTWPRFLIEHCQIRRARADELIMIADGRTSLADLRVRKAESVRATRERKKEDSPLRSGESEPAEDRGKEERMFWKLVAFIDDGTRETFFASLNEPTFQFDPLAELEVLQADNVSLATERNQALAEVERLNVEVDRLRSRVTIQKQLDDARKDLAIAQRKSEFQLAGEIAYGAIPRLEKQIAQFDDGGPDFQPEAFLTKGALAAA